MVVHPVYKVILWYLARMDPKQTSQPTAKKAIAFAPALQLPISYNDVLSPIYGKLAQAAMAEALFYRGVDERASLARVDLAILFDGGSLTSRSELFPVFQSLLAGVYTAICSQATSYRYELDYPGGVDARVFALDAPYNSTQTSNTPREFDSTATTSGPFSSMAAFVSSRSKYSKYHAITTGVSEDCSERGFGEYWKALQEQQSVSTYGPFSGLHSEDIRNSVTDRALTKENSKKHFRVAVGGTFDHLHIGHKLLLTATIFIAQPGSEDREITIGITGDELLVNKKHASVLESWDIRQQRSADFVESILVYHADVPSIRKVEHFDEPGPNGKVVKVTYAPSGSGSKVTINYVRISDPFGPTITDESISALVISGETRAGGKAVNDKRTEKEWAPLEVFEVDVLDAGHVDQPSSNPPDATKTSFESKISSTEIRRRLATGEGAVKSA